MKKIIAFGASNSQNSINQQLAKYASAQIEDAEVRLIDLNDFEMPIFSVDREKEEGIPARAREFKQLIREADGIVISLAEHNGSYSTAFKNVFDWASRVEKAMWLNKPMFLMATSPGGRGGKSVLNLATGDFPHRSGEVVSSFSLPSYYENFSPDEGILNQDLNQKFEKQLAQFTDVLEGQAQAA